MVMETDVISNKLSELLNNRDVRAAAFTTYTFEPEFFELEVIPLLLNGEITFSSDERVKQFQVREALRLADLPLEVFYDLNLARLEASVSPAMQYLCHGVSRGNNAFHAKLNLILVHDPQEDCESLLVGAGSNNLSKAGWWDNIECQHWEEVKVRGASRRFLNRLLQDVAYLQSEQHLSPDDSDNALLLIETYLDSCRASNEAEAVGYYGIAPERNLNFPRFLTQQASTLWSYSNWTLEIISPFFADDAKNMEHQFFYELGVKDIHLLLPIDQEGIPTCQKEYFDHIDEQDNIHWAEWDSESGKQLELTGERFRRLHAKVYHFYNKVQSWAFVGSINFSHKAMWNNVEAGFFVKLNSTGPLLKPIKNTSAIEHFNDPTDLLPGADENLSQERLPQIHLAYDWLKKTLTGVTEKHHSYTIDLLTPEGEKAVSQWKITGAPSTFDGAIEALEALLKNGSLIKVSGRASRSDEPFAEHRLLLQQTGWSHKPLDLPDLTPEQILTIYAGMSPERRQLLLLKASMRKLIMDGTAGEITAPDDDSDVGQFFSEYAEIFYAFRKLKELLQENYDLNNWSRLDYYLSGAGMDSLPALIERITADKNDEESTHNAVTIYLLLLCCKEVFQSPQFQSRPRCKKQLQAITKELSKLRKSDTLVLEDNSAKSRRQFFTWFESQFFKEYKKKEPGTSV
jgi:hypothetical protein